MIEYNNSNFEIMNKNLNNYNLTENQFNINKINDLIFNRNKRFVGIFKEYLFINDDTEFLSILYSKKISQEFLIKYSINNIKYPNINFINREINKLIQKNRINKNEIVNSILSKKIKKSKNILSGSIINIKKLLEIDEQLSFKKNSDINNNSKTIDTIELNYENDIINEIIIDKKDNNENNNFSFFSTKDEQENEKEEKIKTIKIYKYKKDSSIINTPTNTKLKQKNSNLNHITNICINKNQKIKRKVNKSFSNLNNNNNNKNKDNSSQKCMIKTSSFKNNKKLNKCYCEIKKRLLDIKSGKSYKHLITKDRFKTISNESRKSIVFDSNSISKKIKKNLTKTFIQIAKNKIDKDNKIKKEETLSNKSSLNSFSNFTSALNSKRKYNKIDELFYNPKVIFNKTIDKPKKNIISKNNNRASSFIHIKPSLMSNSYNLLNNIKSTKNQKKNEILFPYNLFLKESNDSNTTRENTRKTWSKSKIQKNI